MTTEFKLVEQINSLLDLDAKNALVPHGIGGLARELLTSAAAMLAAAPASPQAAQPVAWEVTGAGGHTVTPQYPKWAEGDLRLTVKALVHADTHADAGEVDKWKEIAGRRTAERTEFMNERDDLRAKLAEVEKIAAGYENRAIHGPQPNNVSSSALARFIREALSTTAKPEADHE